MSSQARAADARAGDESGPVMVADRYRIHPDQPLPALDAAGGIRAFNTTDERGSPKALFALVCRRDVAPRTEVLNQFARFNRLPLVTRSEEHTSELQSLMRISYDVFCFKK